MTVALEGDQSVFDAYYARKSRGWNVADCTGDCVTAEICQLRAARSQNNCVIVTPGVDFRKRDFGGAMGDGKAECGGSVVGKIVGRVRGRV